MRDLLLTGFMGTGKTTVGRLVAARLGRAFLDMDAEIERRAGRTVAQIFSQSGEATFREMERQILRELRDGGGRVVATGGGALIAEENRALLGSDQIVICLTCSVPELLQRLGGSEDRPLLGDMSVERVQSLLHARERAYRRFARVDTTGRSPDEIADEIVACVSLEAEMVIHFSRQAESRILVEDGALDQMGEVLRATGADGLVVLVTDETIERESWPARVEHSLSGAGFRVETIVIAPGEQQKSVECLSHLYDRCAEVGLDRGGTVLGLGGGVVGDLAGMLAATYMRGVRLVLAPTTLLAQVDAAVGGKVAIDLPAGKNLVGAFHPAALVITDPQVLKTLAPDHLSQGLAEMIKIAAVRSHDLLDLLMQLPDRGSIVDRVDLIRRAVAEKAAVVRVDPYERGERMLLNFGHTVGHAVEAASDYRLPHGDAVAVGMVAELRLGIEEGWSPPELLDPLRQFLARMRLPQLSFVDAEQAFMRIGRDKKRAGAAFRFALPVEPGVGRVFEVSETEARRALDYAIGGAA